ncbi:hypothetical protein BS78_01G284400 [Paspalum vaginatum]|nr:hypothetical protein BS78_01G284400 [Paspalum vaginatum]
MGGGVAEDKVVTSVRCFQAASRCAARSRRCRTTSRGLVARRVPVDPRAVAVRDLRGWLMDTALFSPSLTPLYTKSDCWLLINSSTSRINGLHFSPKRLSSMGTL